MSDDNDYGVPPCNCAKCAALRQADDLPPGRPFHANGEPVMLNRSTSLLQARLNKAHAGAPPARLSGETDEVARLAARARELR